MAAMTSTKQHRISSAHCGFSCSSCSDGKPTSSFFRDTMLTSARCGKIAAKRCRCAYWEGGGGVLCGGAGSDIWYCRFFGSIGVFLTMRGPGYNARTGIRNALYRCIFPLSKVETPFMEVLLADGLTSLGKPLFDLGLGGCMLLTTSTQSSWGERAEVCTESSVLPYIFWAAPFIIRARQTWVSANASAGCRRMIHLTNFVKYTTAFPVMYYAFKYSRDIDRESETSLSVSRLYVESAWIFACVMNALYGAIHKIERQR
eukprot:GEMP01074942.1.p1 GENE.GEMP01074942.1~~GEMP01074942.1.p1  ORF type:complete len:259 (+),score=30.84 GEMP01074942.1:175-951(+)